jgi:hypothetical protein
MGGGLKLMSNKVLVVHSNGASSLAKRSRAQAVVDAGLGYWAKNSKRDVLIMRKSTDDAPVKDYEYRGAFSFDSHAPRDDERDQTGIPVQQAGGQKVMQLRKLRNRRSQGWHITKPEDPLWRPERKRKP